MKRLLALSAGCVVMVAAWGQASKVEQLVTLPGDRFENIYQMPDGTLYFTAVFTNKVMRRTPDGKLDVLTDSLHNPQGVLPYGSGFVVNWHERTPDFLNRARMTMAGLGQHLSVLDASGKVVKTLSGPDEAAFYNGMSFTGPDTLLISDSSAGRILNANLKTGVVSVWLDKPAIVAALGGTGSPNGLKVHKGWVYFARGDIYRVEIGADGGPKGVPIPAARTGGTDDFDVASDGTVYAGSGRGVLKVATDGTTSVLLDQGVPSITAVRVAQDGKAVFAVGGGLPFQPDPAPGYVTRIALP